MFSDIAQHGAQRGDKGLFLGRADAFEHRVIGLRNVQEAAIFKVQSAIKEAVRVYLRENDFTEFISPKLLPGATEGGAEVFKLDYFGKEEDEKNE